MATREELEAQAAAAGIAPPPLNAPVQPSIPIQAGGTPAMYNPATGAITAPDITTTTEKKQSIDTSAVPETEKIKSAEESQAETRAMAEEAAQKMAAARVQEETFRAEQADRENELLKQQIAEQDRIRTEENARVEQARTELRARQADHANFKPESFSDSMGTFRQALAAIGMGLGAWGASRGGGPNTAFDIFKAAENSHMAKQRALLDQKVAMVEQAGGNVQQAIEQRNRALAEQGERSLQKNKFLQNMIEAKIKRIPKASAEGAAELAKLRKDYDAVEMETAQKLAGTRTVHGPESSTTTVSGKPAPSTGGPTPMNVIDSYTAAKNAERDLSAGAASLSDEKAFSEWQEAYRDELRTQIQNRGGMKGITNLGQVLGAVEMNLADRLKTPGARAVNRAMVPVVARQARKLDSVGAMSDMTIDKAESSLGLASTTAQEMATVARGLAADEATKARAIEQQYPTLAGQKPVQQPAQPPTAPPRVPAEGQTPAQKKYTAEPTKQIAQDKRDFRAERKALAEATKLLKEKDLTPQQRGALEWAKKNPGDPRARQAIDKIGGK